MHPVTGVHLDPERPRMQRREVGLDEEEAGRDARLPECAREMVVIGDVERACGPEDRGNGWASRYLRRAWCPSCFGKCPTPATLTRPRSRGRPDERGARWG